MCIEPSAEWSPTDDEDCGWKTYDDMTPEEILKENIDNYICTVRADAERDAELKYKRKIDLLQKECDMHIQEKSSLMETYTAVKQYTEFLEKKIDTLKEKS